MDRKMRNSLTAGKFCLVFFFCCFPLSRYIFWLFFEELLVVFPRIQKRKKKSNKSPKMGTGVDFFWSRKHSCRCTGLVCIVLTDTRALKCWNPPSSLLEILLFSMRNVVWILGFSCLGVVWGGGRFGSTWQRWWELQQHQVFRFTLLLLTVA